MPIKGLSDARRMPRLGKIHLGVKKYERKDGTECSPYPVEVDYFVCPPEVQAVFGEKPKSLRIMLPVENEEKFFPQYYKRYTVNLLICKGDGEKANCWAEDGSGLKEIPCPCDHLKSGNCKQIGILCFLLPDVPGFGVYQITTSSKNSLIDINSGLDMVRAICGRVRMIPLILKREKMEIQRIEEGKPKKSSHHTLKIALDERVTLRQLQESAQIKPEMALLPPPPDESRDDLFYPPNGFKDETEEEKAEEPKEKPKQEEKPKDAAKAKEDEEKKKAKEKEAFEKAEFAKVGHDLEALLKGYQDLGGKIGKKQAERIGELKTIAEINKAIEFFTLKKQALEEQAEAEKMPF